MESSADPFIQVSDEPTGSLLLRVAAGEDGARSALVNRYLAPLERFARGRLPLGARDMVDTGDIVQEVLIRSLNHVAQFDNRGTGALFGYLRQAVLNRLRDESRRVSRTPPRDALLDARDTQPSPLEELLGRETLENFERSLLTLEPDEQAAVLARVEMGMTYPEIARDLGKPSADAARMFVGRALAKLSRTMAEGPGPVERPPEG